MNLTSITPLKLFLFGALLILPWCGRAFFIDDHYHLLMAQGILNHPARPYDFVSIDAGPAHRGWEAGQKPRMVNPPLFHYGMALGMALGFKNLFFLRFLTGLISLASLFFAWDIFQRHGLPGVLAGLFVLFSPAFYLTSYSLLIDGCMLTFFLAALWAFVRSPQGGSKWAALSGLAMGAATLTKYTAFLIVPVVLLWCLLYERSWKGLSRFLISLLILGALQGLWAFWNVKTYGASHLLTASQRVTGLEVADWAKMVVVGTFFSGSFLFPLGAFVTPLRHGPAKSMAFTLVFLIGALAWFLQTPKGGFSLGQACLIGIFLAASLWFFIFVGMERLRTLQKEDIFFFGWLMGGLAMMSLVMGWVAGRYFLVVLVPAVGLWLRHIQAAFPKQGQKILAVSLIITGFFSLGLAYADFRQAGFYRSIGRVLEPYRKLPASGYYFLGDSFVGYTPYLQKAGWQALFLGEQIPQGALLVKNDYTAPSWWSQAPLENQEHMGAIEFRSYFPLRVMDLPASAGFYASAWGALPWSFSQRPWERFHIFKMSRDKVL